MLHRIIASIIFITLSLGVGALGIQIEESEYNISMIKMERRVIDSFESSFRNGQGTTLPKLIAQLKDQYAESRDERLLYWKGFAIYYNSILFLKNGDNQKAESEVNRGIEILKSIKSKSSDTYALLSMLQNYSCQFARFPSIIKLSREATASIEKAIEIDPNNPRALYIYANNDFNVPESYGGGKRVEEFAIKSLSLPVSTSEDLLTPTWGRQECYELITNYYIRRGDQVKALRFIDMGLSEYPNSFMLNSNKNKISK